MIEAFKLIGTTSTGNGGAATITAERPVIGLLRAVEWVDGDLANNNTAVLSVTNTDSGVDYAVLTLGAGEGDNDIFYYPMAAAHDRTATARMFNDESDEPVVAPIVIAGILQLVIASGGDAKTGGAIVYVEL